MAITIDNGAHPISGSGTSIQFTMTSTMSNDVWIVAMYCRGTGVTGLASVTSPNLTWTRLRSVSVNVNGPGDLSVWYAKAPNPLSAEVITFTAGGASASFAGGIACLNGVHSINSPFDSNGTLPQGQYNASQTGFNWTYSTTQKNDWVVIVEGKTGLGGVGAPPTGFTNVFNQYTSPQESCALSQKTLTAQTTNATFTGASNADAGILFALTADPKIDLKAPRRRNNPMSVYRTSTGVIYRFKIYDSSLTDGTGKTGLTNATSGLKCSYSSDGATATPVTLVNTTVGTWASGGFVEIDALNMPGWYEFGVPNAALSASGRRVQLTLFGATNMYAVDQTIDLTNVNDQDGVHFGLTALPNVIAGANGGLPLGDASGNVGLKAAEHTNIANDTQTGLTAQGYTTARAPKLDNLDATVSSRATPASFTASFPANFSLLAIDSSGFVSVNNLSAIVNAVWDEPQTNHTIAGSTGDTLNQAAQSAGTPWTRIY